MIPITPEYTTAINADERYIKPKVLVYFDGDSNPPILFEENGVVSIQLLEESRAESGNPLGQVSSNELTVSFDNSARAFTPTNTLSPYYGKLKPNTLIKPYLALETTPGVFEEIPLGVFRTGDWSSPSGSVEASVTCYDKLYEIGDKDVPMLPVKQNTTIAELFLMLFQALGVTEYSIDPSLTQAVLVGWLPKGKVRDALQVLATAGNCSARADRYERIVVQSNHTSGIPVETWTDNNQVETADNPQKYLDVYSVVKVNYKQPYIKVSSSLLKIENLTIPNGGLTMSDIEFTSAPVTSVDQVRLIGATNAMVANVQYGAHTITLQITNPSDSETVTLEVTGRVVEMLTSAVTVQDDDAVAGIGTKEFKVDNYLIQSKAVAESYAYALLQYVKDPLANLTISARGNPALEPGDVLQIQDPTDKIETVNVVPFRLQLNYDGALDCSLNTRKAEANMIYDHMFISPGLNVRAARVIPQPVDTWSFVLPGFPILSRRYE